MPQLITNAIIVTNDGNGTIHHAADLLIAGNRIIAIGQGLAAQHPGLANIHTHFVMTLAPLHRHAADRTG